MKRIILSVCLLAVCFLLFSSCGRDVSEQDLAVCGSYGVPGMFCYDLKGGTYSCQIIEADKYGRILFEYTATNIISGEEESVLAICQKTDSEYVYFYEDICYLALDHGADLSYLKEQNDWEKPLDMSKLSRRSNQVTYDLTIHTDSRLQYDDLYSSCLDALGDPSVQILELCFLDADPLGQELLFLRTKSGDSVEEFFVFANLEYDVFLLQIEDSKVDSTDLVKFKQEHGWKYGIS